MAMLGVLKAGGVFVPLDPTHPTARLQTLTQAVNARIVLCSSNHEANLKSVAETLVPLNHDALETMSTVYQGAGLISDVKSHNAAYIIFTSGSTGSPKVLQRLLMFLAIILSDF